MVMEIWKKLKHGIDVLSTPPAPKIGRIPLPDLEDAGAVKDIVVHLERDDYAGDDYFYDSDQPSPTSPILRKRKGSVSLSRSPTPQHRCASRSSSSSYPRTPDIAATPTIVAPTPRWHVAETLREDGWKHCPTPSHHERPEATKTHAEKAKRASSKAHSPSRSTTPQSPSALSASPVERPPRPRTNSTRDERRVVSEPKRRRHEALEASRPPTTVPATEYLAERALPLERGTLSTVKRPLKGILKSTPKAVPIDPVYLHWQLLPYDPTKCKKKLLYDVALGVSFIRDHSRMPPLALGSADLDKAAANIKLTEMTIRCRQLPHWDIIVHNPSGVTCGDVFHAVHDTLCTPLTDRECKKYVTEDCRDKVLEAFEKRCRDTPGLDEYTRLRGVTRVDLLEGRRIFVGLSCPIEAGSDFWMLDLAHLRMKA